MTARAQPRFRPVPELGEPWEEPVRQHQALLFGLWLFIATEILFFGGFFLLYAVARLEEPTQFATGAREAELLYGTINTFLLLTSSATLTVAERASQAGWRAAARAGLLATIVLGLLFLGVKGWEYHEDLAKHLFPRDPAFPFHTTGAIRFWAFYWLITLIHAVHLTIGIGAVTRLWWMERRGRLIDNWMSAEVTTLYWHFVDIVWLLVWPLLYLVGR